MFKVNENYLKLPGSYLFADIAKKVSTFANANPDKEIIRLGIGDVTKPLSDAVIKGLHNAVDEMAEASTFKGYGPDQGYPFLINAIIENDYVARGVSLDPDEVFISDGAKSDSGNIGDILGNSNKIGICDPVYPVYIDTNVMAGRVGDLCNGTWSELVYMPCLEENNFAPSLPEEKVDVIYLCLPNNPTGSTLTKDELKVWVDYALENESLILFDGAYEAFITEDNVPHSIYEIEGAKKCAIEFRSFSKTAGFTGTRCAYTVVPKELKARTDNGQEVSLNSLWNRRQATKLNGVSYIIQKAALATYTEEGKKQVRSAIDYYMNNARVIRDGLFDAGFKVSGGINSPYVWLRTPNGLTSWEFFDLLLTKVQVVGTPGVGFGPHGEGYFRLTGFGNDQKTKEAVQRIVTNIKL